MQQTAKTIFLLLSLFCPLLWSRQIVESFDTLTYRNTSSTAIWNIVQGKIHAPYFINRNPGTPGQEDESVPIGTGADGVFSSSTSATFDTNHGANSALVTLNTASTYNFTTFTLAQGVTLKGSGTSPLILHVQGDVLISGTIDLRGSNGSDATSPYVTSANGGTASSGGGSGGSGLGFFTAPNAIGGNAGASGGGGGGASVGAGIAGAGGGGGNRYAGAVGGTGAGAGGTAGSAYNDDNLVPLLAGSGGGGGGAHTTEVSSGAGGGGGGGAIAIYAGGNITVSSTGHVLTTGGNGGSAGSYNAGAGGGGAGGSVIIFAAGTFSENGTINSQAGSGGTGAGGIDGGVGSDGVNRFATASGTLSGTGSESPAAMPGPITVFSQLAYTIESLVIDSRNTSPEYTSITREQTLNGGTATIEMAGSSDGFVSDTTGYVAESSLSSLSGKRYFKFRVTLQSASATASPEITKLTFNITDRVQTAFHLKVASCAAVTNPSEVGFPSLLVSLLLIMGAWVLGQVLSSQKEY
jgi:hypothetical protein